MNRQDFAMAHLLLDHARRPTTSAGEPASTEEIALLVEGKAEEILGGDRVRQLHAQLDTDPSLYQTWLQMIESQELDGSFQALKAAKEQVVPETAKPAGHPPHQETWLDRFKSLIFPRPSFAVALSLCALSVLLTWQFMDDGDPGRLLVISEGHRLDTKASLSNAGDNKTLASEPGPALANLLRCTAPTDTTKPYFCYTNTPEVQHWFTVNVTGLHPITNPVIAKKIGGLKQFKDKLVVEFVKNGQFALSYFTVETIPPMPTLKLEHQDTISDGYFDHVVIDDRGLRYERVQDNSETKHVSIP